MHNIIEIFKGLILGILGGIAVGCLSSWNLLSRSYTGWKTVWHDCGQILFIPMFMGAIIGLVSRMEKDSHGGFITSILTGMGAGFFAPMIFHQIFGKRIYFSFGSIDMLYVPNLTFMVCGGAAAFVWHFSINKLWK
ncbi:MAG: hypothetical protein U9Q34_06320 [Elusimicrobiota bacterium]|nr:hypothetical protein [Elusimicrobiota bacterium]